MKNIAILGASSHIAKGLINNFLGRDAYGLHLFTKSPGKVAAFLASIGNPAAGNVVIHDGYHDFQNFAFHLIINCVGVGTLAKLKGDFSAYFTVTEEYDNLIIRYLRDVSPDTLYVSLSSGAVYGRAHTAPVEESTINPVLVNHLRAEDSYSIVRMNSEAKHRAFASLNIVDLRIFSYFSRFIDFADGYFITDLIECILKGTVLSTDRQNIVRDFLHPEDLFSMITLCAGLGRINAAYDVVSAAPANKMEILECFSRRHGLKYEFCQSVDYLSATGAKPVYCSNFNAASKIGYAPQFTSIATLIHESEYLLTSGRIS